MFGDSVNPKVSDSKISSSSEKCLRIQVEGAVQQQQKNVTRPY